MEQSDKKTNGWWRKKSLMVGALLLLILLLAGGAWVYAEIQERQQQKLANVAMVTPLKKVAQEENAQLSAQDREEIEILIQRQTHKILLQNRREVHIFMLPNCIHCKHQKQFLQDQRFEERFPYLDFVSHDLSQPGERKVLREFVLKSGMDAGRLGTPVTFINDSYVLGFDPEKLTQEIEGYASTLNLEARAKATEMVQGSHKM